MAIEDSKLNNVGEKTEEKDVELGKISTTSQDGKESREELSVEHREYLMQRHGKIDLLPIPSRDPAEPYNWKSWRKNVNLVLVSFHAMMAIFTAASIIPAYELIAEELGVSLQRATYLSSSMIVVLGISPLFWKPISNRYGRRPVWLLSTLCSAVLNIGCANTHSYGSQIIARILEAFFICPALAIGSGVVMESFFAHERGTKVGIWALFVTLGAPSGPFIMGFVAQHLGWRWIYWLLAIINGVQFVLYIFFGPETLYLPAEEIENDGRSSWRKQYFSFRAIGINPLKARDFYQPLLLARIPSILIPTISYTLVFSFASILLTIEIPQTFGQKFHLDAQQIGLQFIALIIGSVVGEQAGGPLSDYFRMRYVKRRGHAPSPENRLWLSYFGFLMAIVGLLIFGIRLSQAEEGRWNVTPLVGVGIAAFGNQLITTVLVTYAVDSAPQHSTSIGVFVNAVRSTWGFIGPFWFPPMFESIDFAGSMGLLSGLILVFAVLPIALVQWRGPQWRKHGQATVAQ